MGAPSNARFSELRYDPIADRWAIIAEERGNRPFNAANVCACATLRVDCDYDPECPFCPGAEEQTTPTVEFVAVTERARRLPHETLTVDDFEIVRGSTQDACQSRRWFLRVVENKFPILRMSDQLEAAELSDAFARFLTRESSCNCNELAFGRHEVIVDAVRHCRGWAEMTSVEIKLAFRVFRSRLRALRASDQFGYAFVFKNVGESAGASQPHTHCQLTANASVPPELEAELRRLDAYERARRARGDLQTYWSALVSNELKNGLRVVLDTERFLAYCPYASRFPMLVEICPKFDEPFEEYADPELDELALLARKLVALLQRAKTIYVPTDPRALDYNVYLRNAPYRATTPFRDALRAFRPRWVIVPTLVKKAGYELGCGLDVNPVSPETAAARLRNVLECASEGD